MQADVFDRVVTGFYRAATGESPWAVAMAGVQTAFAARAVVLQTIDAATGRILALDVGGPAIHACRLDYLRTYHAIDPRRGHLLRHATELNGQWWHDHETHDEAFVAQDVYHQQFLPAYNLRYLSAVMLRPSADALAGFALELPASRGMLSAYERETARRLGEHLHDALRAHERIRALAAQALAGHALLGAFTYPMWLIDTDRFIHYANPAALVEAETALHIAQRGTHLVLTRTRCDARLTEHIDALRDAPHGRTAVLDLRANRSDAPIWLQLSLLKPAEAAGIFGERPQVLATLFDPQRLNPLDPFALAQVLGLTPAQARVAAQLAEGMSGDQIAAANGTAVSTVRSHISAVLGRLGARRMSDAVRALRQGEALWASAPT